MQASEALLVPYACSDLLVYLFNLQQFIFQLATPFRTRKEALAVVVRPLFW